MKIIEALKKIKHLDRKVEKNLQRIKKWAAYVEDTRNPEPPLYNKEELVRMVQQIADWTTEKMNIRHLLHKTNLTVAADWNGKSYTIDELLLLQALGFPVAMNVQSCMSRRDANAEIGYGGKEFRRVVMQYDPKERDKTTDKLDDNAMKLNDLLDKLSLETEVVD